MCVQRMKASDQKIDFFVTYTNIRTNEEDEMQDQAFDSGRVMYSPRLMTDEQRVMQVLLGL